MASLPQLIDPETYRPCDWDLKRDAAGRAYWVKLFCEHLELLTALIAEEYPEADAKQTDAFRRDYLATMQAIQCEPEHFETINVRQLTRLRREVQLRHGFRDPFRGIKQRENDIALVMLPELLSELDAMPPETRLEALVKGLLAGNIFDLGSRPTAKRYRQGRLHFHSVRNEQPARPWFIDNLDEWHRRCEVGPGYRQVLFFVDNAGSDICLGCLPFARWFLQSGARVTLAANSEPTLNDVTAPELLSLLSQVSAIDDVISMASSSQQLSVTASGCVLPLIDLTDLAPSCTDNARDADLIIIHGMGRAIESNFQARFRCDAIWSATLKDPAIAEHIGGRLFDCVFRFRSGAAATISSS